ncbi:MAG: thermonuclease family protein [Planctomycetota bacterium]|nr:thermonuclease family protein [Planctomycetota bacterium]
MKQKKKRSTKRWKRRRRLIGLGVLAALGLLIIADRSGCLLARRGDDMAVYHGMEARVVAVLDGDTIEVDLPDALHDRPTTRVRLCGIDCPEPARPRQPAEPWAEEATELTLDLTEDATITLWLEPHSTRGVFGRVLAHVELPDGSFLNEALLAAGLAVADDRWPHAKLTRYAQLENTARRQGRGIWSEEE